MMGVARQRDQHFPVLVATVIQLIASLILIFFYLMLFLQVPVGMGLSNKEDRERMYRLHHRLYSAMPMDWLLP